MTTIGKEGTSNTPDKERPLTPEEVNNTAFRLIGEFCAILGKDVADLQGEGKMGFPVGESFFDISSLLTEGAQQLEISRDTLPSERELIREKVVLKSGLSEQSSCSEAEMSYYRELSHTNDPISRVADNQLAIAKIEEILASLKSSS